MKRLRLYLSRSVFLMISFFVCVFFTIDLIVGLTLDPSFLDSENLIGSQITAVLSAIFAYKLLQTREATKNHDTA